ncbi:hypothetical protein [Nocardia sp. NPDC127526]
MGAKKTPMVKFRPKDTVIAASPAHAIRSWRIVTNSLLNQEVSKT